MKVLTAGEVADLLNAAKTKRARTIEAILDYLSQHPEGFAGTSDKFAQTIGVASCDFWGAMNEIRSAEFQELNDWTIPYVRKGPSRKVYKLAASDAEVTDVMAGMAIRLPELAECQRRADARIGWMVDHTDGRTLEGKLARALRTQAASAAATADMLAELVATA